MAITLGTNGYISLSDFKAWADMRGNDYSAYSDTQIEQAITVSGVDYLDTQYVFKGTALVEGQPMQLPTDLVAIADISKAAAQAAWQQLTGKLFAPISTGSAGGAVTMVRKKLDVLETETRYSEGVSLGGFTYDTTLIKSLLKPFLSNSSGGLGEERW
jgi:hypothetical protein